MAGTFFISPKTKENILFFTKNQDLNVNSISTGIPFSFGSLSLSLAPMLLLVISLIFPLTPAIFAQEKETDMNSTSPNTASAQEKNPPQAILSRQSYPNDITVAKLGNGLTVIIQEITLPPSPRSAATSKIPAVSTKPNISVPASSSTVK